MASTDELGLTAALALVREIPDFPEPGVLFRDLGPVFADGPAFRALIDALAEGLDPATELIVAVEARGFLLGAALGYATGLGVVPVRKPGKTPIVADRVEYQLEYGTATLELPEGLIAEGRRTVVVDDVLATGGTAAATCALVERAGAQVTGISLVIELAALGGRDRLAGRNVHALLTV
ncbi:MAG TPA: adenine phosphoribosyltransferase [Pseudonocardiaceae bacterium]|jgi:adenine phosphoribosyltransferase|nr:adenine phosphoribosyltransferase [Pseudonocardiaceae bacterium]